MSDPIILDDYEQSLVEGFILTKQPRTKKVYKREINSFKKFINKELLRATSENCSSYIAFLRKKGKASSTIRRIYDQLKSFYNYSFIEGFIETNPFFKIEKPQASKQIEATRTPPPEHLQKIISSLSENFHPRDYAAIFLIMTSGQRLSKSLSVKWSDFVHSKDHIALKISHAPSRFVVIFDFVWDIIEQYRKYSGIPNSYLNKDYHVFISNKNLDRYFMEPDKVKPITPDWIRKVMERICREADMPLYTAKDLRHAFAIYALNLGISAGKDKDTIVTEVSEQLGLSNKKQMHTRYIGIIEQLLLPAGTYSESFFRTFIKKQD